MDQCTTFLFTEDATNKKTNMNASDFAHWYDTIWRTSPIPMMYAYFYENPRAKGMLVENEDGGLQIEINEEIEGTNMAVRVALHELAHYYLGHLQTHTTPYHHQEVEAEVVAYLVSQAIGLDTFEHSFSYLKKYGGDQLYSLLETSNDQILHCKEQLLSQLTNQDCSSATK